jgi:ThiF family
MSHLIIGAGGTASWLVPLLKRTLNPKTEIRVVDGDILEVRNLDRQLFSPEYIGWNKAEALAEIYHIQYEPSYLERDHWLLTHPTLAQTWSTIWCCADNHIARKLCLDLVDAGQAELAIIGGNEYNDSEAYPYLSAWKGTTGDPRIYYPELLTDASNDPTDPSCQGINQAQNRQLALANYLSAGFMVHLYWFITNHGHEVTRGAWPQRHMCNFAMFNTKPML